MAKKYTSRMAALEIGGDDKKKKKTRVVGYKEKTGEVHPTKKAFYEAKAEKERTDRVVYKTKDGKTFSTKAEYEAHKKKINPGYKRKY